MTNRTPDQFQHLVELLNWRSSANADVRAMTYLENGEDQEITLTYAELDQHARAIAAWLQMHNAYGERVLLLYSPGVDYVTAYLGCLYAGAIAVPAYPPRRREPTGRLEKVVTDANAKFIFTTRDIIDKIGKRFDETPALAPLTRLLTEEMPLEAADDWHMPDIKRSDVAFLQYTSGSTAAPKGVMVTHGSLMANEDTIYQGFEHDQPTVVSWLPIYHDMGLIGNILQPLYLGAHTVVMSPTAFVQRPIRWLKAISNYRGTSSGGPNFGYELCTDKITEEEKEGLDLSSWTVAYNGAEPIRAQTLRDFAESFADYGFSPTAFYPCYGLAEATLFVSGGPKTKKPRYASFDAHELERNQIVPLATGENARELVSSGKIWGQTVKIVDTETFLECDVDHVGEIWISGENVAAGYWGNAAATDATFNAFIADTGEGPFLRTGDLGFTSDGELFVTGRIKDMIIIRGRNHYPQDIELTVQQSHPALRADCTAAFSIDVDGEEQLIVLQELERESRLNFDPNEIFAKVLQEVSREHQLQPHSIVLLNTLSILKTSSGKIQRQANRRAYLEDQLDVLAAWVAPKMAPQEVAEDVEEDIAEEPLAVSSSGYDFGNAIYPTQTGTSKSADDLILWIREYASTRINSRVIDERRTIPPYVVLDMGNRGLLGLQVPKKYGGLELGYLDTIRIIEQLGAIDQTLALFVGLGNILGVRPILNWATPEVKAQMLPLLATGRELGAFALSEPGAGSNPRGIRTSAMADGNGGFLIRGQKVWSGIASWAGVINVFVQEQDASGRPTGMSAFVVRQGTRGLRQGPEAMTMGMRGMVQNTIFFEDVPVSDEQRLGTSGGGMDVAQDAMMYGRLAIAAASVGSMKRAAQLSLRYADRRTVATGRLLQNPVTLVQLGEMTAATDALDSMVVQTAQALDAGWDVPAEVFTICKIAGPELAWQAVDRLAQMFGGRGYIETNLIPQFMRDIRILRVFEGPTETLLQFLGAKVLSQPDELMNYLTNYAGTDAISKQIGEAIASVRERVAKSGLFDSDVSRMQWAYNLCGELVTYGGLVNASYIAYSQTGEERYQRAQAWAEEKFQRLLDLAKAGQTGENFAIAADNIQQLIDDYQGAIGDVEQTLAGEDHEYDAYLRKDASASEASLPVSAPATKAPAVKKPAAKSTKSAPAKSKNGVSATQAQNWISDWMIQNMQIPRGSIDTQKPFAEYGMDSVRAVEFAQDLEDWLDGQVIIDELTAWNFPTIKELVAYIVGEVNEDGEPQNPKATEEQANDLDELSDDDFAELLAQEIEASKKWKK